MVKFAKEESKINRNLANTDVEMRESTTNLHSNLRIKKPIQL